MAVATAGLALLFDVSHFAACCYFTVAADNAAAAESREAEKSDETHSTPVDVKAIYVPLYELTGADRDDAKLRGK
jgi:hypothetical protein